MIQLQQVWKTYSLESGPVNALQDISLTIPDNSFSAIIGPSGSGKSTLMCLIGCLDLPTQGTITLNGRNISKYSEDELAKIRGKMIGFVFQKFNLIPTLSALQNVMLPMMFQGTNQKVREKKAQELLTFVGLASRLSHRPSQLSGGEQQRVAIARSLANDPDIILADEPTGNLDSVTGTKIIELFQKLHSQGKTIIFVTHDTKMKQYAQNVITLRDGQLTGG
ncbi:MAG: hypothetical protein QT02_C0006G0041 [archaeon GW2011_AR9]|nr:MAG: hypothetical protein QT02_C0006G0041 [archaeon GW2011_AR9]MBS3120441.1 ABC transporter ATP-binding protein [Candidatus Woesearchaeota archaeon]HIG93740.1 ABC transporter ATP-binding protein [Candidatus Woesearchaeota archaeon]HIH12597.1 ABC transporter ATP-binding protein [Candidatus Woesearchaeota archaeon]